MGRYLLLDQFHDLAFGRLVAPGTSIRGLQMVWVYLIDAFPTKRVKYPYAYATLDEQICHLWNLLVRIASIMGILAAGYATV